MSKDQAKQHAKETIDSIRQEFDRDEVEGISIGKYGMIAIALPRYLNSDRKQKLIDILNEHGYKSEPASSWKYEGGPIEESYSLL